MSKQARKHVSVVASSSANAEQISITPVQMLDTPAPFALTGANGVIRAASRGWCDLFGYAFEAMIGLDLASLAGGTSKDAIQRALEDAHAAHGRRIPIEITNPRAPESSLAIELTVARVSATGDGWISWHAADLTRQRDAEGWQRVLTDAIDCSAEAILIKDLDGIVLHWNKEAAALFGFSAAEALGRSMRGLHAADLTDIEWQGVLKRIRSGVASSSRAERRRKNGETVVVEIRNSPLFDATGSLIGEITVARDTTELDRTAQSLSAAQADLNARLTQLQTTNDALEREVLERREMAQTLNTTNAELQDTVNDLKWFNHESQVFSEMAEVLQACRTFDEAYAAIGEYGQKLLPDAAGHFFMLRDSRDILEHRSSWGEEYAGESILIPEACWALRRGQVHSTSARGRLRCAHVSAQAMGAVCMPIIGQGQTLGLLHVAAYHEEWESPKQGALTLRRLRTMADRVGPALANLKLRETLRSLSIRDPLTGLFNRRYLEESLPRELHRAQRSGQPVSAIMIDVDHFKRFNDEFGHDAGDVVLRAFSDIIQKNVRPSDMGCRLGGEELVVVLPDASLEIACARAEKLRIALRGLNLQHEGKALGTVTASFGIAAYPQHGSTTEALLHAGDVALYRAKREGRDRVCVASPANS